MPEGQIFDSWKEIAEYLRRTPKTCRRWEHELGLPIRRLDGSSKASIFAYKEEIDRWLNEKLHEKDIARTDKAGPAVPATSRWITVSFIPRKLVVPGVAVLAIVAAMAVILSVTPGRKTVPPPPGKPSLAILYFENMSGDPSLDIWRTGLTGLLITKLSQSRFIRVLDANSLYGILTGLKLTEGHKYTNDDLIRVAEEAEADFTLTGSLIKAGGKIIMTLSLQRPRAREVISPIDVEWGSEAEIWEKVDEVATRIRSALIMNAEQIASDIDRNIGEISTPNAEAWVYYVEARRFHFRGEARKAIPLLEKALALDPAFIMAMRALTVAHLNISNYPEVERCRVRTLELIQVHPERISERERYLFEIGYYYGAGTEPVWAKSFEAGRKLLALYPDDVAGSANLGIIYREIEDWESALRCFEQALRWRDRFWGTFGNMSRAYRAIGEPGQAQKVLERYLREVEDAAVGHLMLADHHVTQNRLDLAGRELEKAEALAPDDYRSRKSRGDLFLLLGDAPRAEAEYRALIEKKVPEALTSGYQGLVAGLLLEGRYEEIIRIMGPLAEEFGRSGDARGERLCRGAVAYSLLRSGRAEAALEECDKAYGIETGNHDLDSKREALHLKGLACVALKRTAEAERTAEELKALIDKGLNKKAIRLYDHLKGAIEIDSNDASKALEDLERAVRSLPYGPFEKDAGFIHTLAEAYVRAGDLTRAREQYERIGKLTTGRLGSADLYARSFYHLGLIDEELDDQARARGNYQKFLDLWKDADPGLPEVKDARKRLAGLKGNCFPLPGKPSQGRP